MHEMLGVAWLGSIVFLLLTGLYAILGTLGAIIGPLPATVTMVAWALFLVGLPLGLLHYFSEH